MNENLISGDENQSIRDDILTMVGGHFTPKALGRELYEEILGRARSNAMKFLVEFETMFLGEHFDAITQADLLLPTFLKLLQDVEPERVRSTAERLLKQYNAVLTFHDAIQDRAALHKLLPEDSMRLSQRLDSRRRELQELTR